MAKTGHSLRDRVWRLFAGRELMRETVVHTRTHVATPSAASASGARLSVVALAGVRERLGERWGELSERVHDLAEVVIRRHLTRGDVFDAHGEDGYMVLFAQLSPIEAEFKCRVIAKEIAAKLLGAEWAGRSSIEGATFELSRSALDQPDFKAALSRAVASATPVIQIGSQPADGSAPQSAGDVEPHSGRPAPAPGVTETAALAKAPLRTLRPVEPREGMTNYWPVWDFGVGALLRFRLGGGPSVYDPEVAPPTAAAKADTIALAKLLFEVTQLAGTGRRLPVICPVALSTMGNDLLRGQLIRVLGQAPPAIRKLVVLEIVAPAAARSIWPSGFTPDARTLPVAFAVRLGLESDPRRLALTGIQQINLELPTDFTATKSALARLDTFAQCALPMRLPIGVMGLCSRPLVLAATASGFRQLAGVAVHPAVAGLGQAVRFDLATLYRDLMPNAAKAL